MAEWRRELERRCTAADLDPRVRDEVEREIAEHLEDRVDDLVAGGASAAEASRAVASRPSVGAGSRTARRGRRE